VGQTPVAWKQALVVPLYKGKGSQQSINNYQGINFLITLNKVYAHALSELGGGDQFARGPMRLLLWPGHYGCHVCDAPAIECGATQQGHPIPIRVP